MSLAGTSVVAATSIVLVLAPTWKSKGAPHDALPAASTGIVPLKGSTALVATAPPGSKKRAAITAASAKSRGIVIVLVSFVAGVPPRLLAAMTYKRRTAPRGYG